jgi:tetratricopeptide (TPR) repeat protein
MVDRKACIALMGSRKKQSANRRKQVQQPEAEAPLETKLWPAVGTRAHLAIVFVLGVIVFCTYANTVHNTGFALDNKFIILEDPRLRVASPGNIKLIFNQDYWWPKAVSGLYRPLTTLSYLFNYHTLGNTDHAAGYHWINFFLHWANTVLVYFAVLVLIEKLWPAFFAAALFGTHPLATESVTNIIGRSDLFATLFLLVGFLCYVKSTTTDSRREPSTKPTAVVGALSVVLAGFILLCWRYPSLIPASLLNWTCITVTLVALGATTLTFACLMGGWGKFSSLLLLLLSTAIGVFCKETGIVVLGVLMLYDFTFRIRQKHPNWLVNFFSNFWEFALKGYVVLAAPVLAMLYTRSWVFGNLRPPELPWVDNNLAMPSVGFWTARLTAIKVIGKYFWLLLWPQVLSCDYSYNQIPVVDWHFRTFEDWKAIIALVSVVTILAVTIRNYRRNKPLFFFVFFFFGTLLPTSNLFPKLGEPLFEKLSWCIGSIMAERFLYMPLIGFAGCAVLAVYAICQHPNVSGWTEHIRLQVIAPTALSVMVVAYGTRSFLRNPDWENDEVLWTKAVEACPNSFKTHKSLAFAIYEKDPEGKNIDRVIAEGEKARAVTDKTQIVMLHLGAYYRIKGDKLAQHAPDGTLLPTEASMPWYQKSVEALLQAVPLDHEFNDDNRSKELKRGRSPDQIPDIGNHEIYWNLGLSYMRLSQYQQALDAYLAMRHLAPTNPDAYLSIASVYLSSGHLEEAADALLQALLLDSNRAEALRLLVNIYHQIDHEGCSVIMSQGQPRLNSDCALVHNHICNAYYGLVQVFLETKAYDLAKQTKHSALETYHCPAESFGQIPDQSSTVSLKP